MLKRNSVEPFILVLTGMTIGAALAVLFAPESGSQDAEAVAEVCSSNRRGPWEEGRDAMETAADRGKEYLETGKEKAKEAVQTAAETLKENLARRTGIL